MPRLSEGLKKDLYLDSLRRRVRHFFTYSEGSSGEKELLAQRLQGFFEAGSILRVCHENELTRIFDEEHLSIFGISQAERLQQQEEDGATAEIDWTIYDPPALERIRVRRGRPRRYSAQRKTRGRSISSSNSV